MPTASTTGPYGGGLSFEQLRQLVGNSAGTGTPTTYPSSPPPRGERAAQWPPPDWVRIGGRWTQNPFLQLPQPTAQLNALSQFMVNPATLYRQQAGVIGASNRAAGDEANQYIRQQGLGPAAYTQFLRDQSATTAAQLGQARGSAVLGSAETNAGLVGTQLQALLGIRGQDLEQRNLLLQLIHGFASSTG